MLQGAENSETEKKNLEPMSRRNHGSGGAAYAWAHVQKVQNK